MPGVMDWLRSFHEEETGAPTTLEVIMILGIAAMFLVFLRYFGFAIVNWCKQQLANILGG
jgi:hypothetical protein